MRSRLRSFGYLLQMAWFGLCELFWRSAEVPTDVADRARPTTSRGRHQWRAAGASMRWTAGAAVVALLATHMTAVTASQAAWVDAEWDHADLATLNCADDDTFRSRAAGRLLGGGLLPLDLDTIATVGGVAVTHDGQTATPHPATASNVGNDGFVNPLDVGALSLVNLPLTGGSLDELLSLDLGNDVGVLNQFARAQGSGFSEGASGVVNDSGVVQTDNNDNGSTPTLGTLKLSTLVQQLTGEAISDVVAGVTDLSLEIGAVAGRATLDGCSAAWEGDVDPFLDRTYAIAGLTAVIDAPVVAGLSTTATGLLDGLETALNGIAGNAGVVSGITGGLTTLLGGVLGALNMDPPVLTGPTIDVDLTAARALVGATISDDAGAVELDLTTGAVRVDLASLIGEAYGGQGFNGTQAHGLNGLPPNTELVVNAAVTNALTAALTEALDGWVADIVAALRAAVYAADVNLTIAVPLQGTVYPPLSAPVTLHVATINITVDGTLQQLLDNTPGTVAATVTVLDDTPVLGTLIGLLVNPLVSGIVSAVTGGLAPVVGGVLEDVVLDPGGLVPTLGATLQSATAPVVSALAQLLVGFLGVDGLVSLQANIQNDAAAGLDPDPAPLLTYPDWETGAQAVPQHRYDVAALAVGVLDALGPGTNVNLELARASVGVNCVIGGVWDAQGLCAGY